MAGWVGIGTQQRRAGFELWPSTTRPLLLVVEEKETFTRITSDQLSLFIVSYNRMSRRTYVINTGLLLYVDNSLLSVYFAASTAPLNNSEAPAASTQDEEPQLMEDDDIEVLLIKYHFLLYRTVIIHVSK